MTSIKKNFLYNLSYQGLLIVFPFVTVPYISRILGPEGIGIYSYTLSIASYFVLLAMLGVKIYGNRSIARVKDDKLKLSKTFWEIYTFQLLTSSLMIVIYILYAILVIENHFLISFIQLIYVLSAAIDISWFYFGVEKFKITVLRGMVIKILGVIAVFIFVKNPHDLWIYVLIMSLTTVLNQLALWPFLLRYVNFIKPTLRDIKAHIKPNIILFIPVIAISLYTIMDKVMVGSLSTMTELGYYENTIKIIAVPFGVITALGTVMIPRMSNLIVNGKFTQSEKYINISMKFVLFISSAMAFGIAGIAPIFAPIFFGEGFMPVGNLMALISPIIIFKAWANVIRTQYLIPTLKDKEYISSVILGAFVNLILNLMLIKPFGALGAVVGTIIAEFTVSLHQTISVRKELDILSYLKSGIFFIINGLIMFVIIRLIGFSMGTSILTLIIEICSGALIYLLLCLVYFNYTKDEVFTKYFNKIVRPIFRLLKK
ncbi:flippase [Psychrobacillus sp. L4]|uniref:flippase n=1 Tax=Psychrobacillus sp. L4 TaxID=3236892 RepID=UPI0036F41E98